MIGDYLFDHIDHLKAEMKHPDLVLRIEVRQDAVYISNQLLHGIGGMPVGTAGKAVMMLSGGIDSPVASYLAMKRGVDIEWCTSSVHLTLLKKALAKAKEINWYFGKTMQVRLTFIAVPFAENSGNY